MARTFITLAVLAVCFGVAAAQMKVCNDKKAPGQPWNSIINPNNPGYDAGSKTMKLTWRSPVKTPGDGCVTMYRLEHYEGNNKVKTEFKTTSPIQEQVDIITSALPCKTLTIKLIAVGPAGESPAENVGTVKTQNAPQTAVPL